MKKSFFKKFPIAIASLLASSTAFAATDANSRLSELESQMEQVRGETEMGTCGATTASARPLVVDRCKSCGEIPCGKDCETPCSLGQKEGCREPDRCGHWFLTFDILYWHANVGGTEYAYSIQDPIASLPVKGRMKDMSFGWDTGLRAGLGYSFVHDGWDAHLEYTWFDSSGSDSTRAGLNSSIVPLRSSQTIGKTPNDPTQLFTFCSSAKSQYDFDYQALDLELGRAYFISPKLSFRPHVGLKSAWIDQEQITRYTGGTPTTEIEVVQGEVLDDPITVVTVNLIRNRLGLGITTVHVKDDCNFWGMGPRAGLESKWHLGCGFSLFGNAAAALLYGLFDVDHKERWTELKDNRIHIHANRHAFSPTVQYQLGLRYDRYIWCGEKHIGIGLGFEGQYFWRQNQMLEIDNRATPQGYRRYSEDVSMHGVTLDFRLDF